MTHETLISMLENSNKKQLNLSPITNYDELQYSSLTKITMNASKRSVNGAMLKAKTALGCLPTKI